MKGGPPLPRPQLTTQVPYKRGLDGLPMQCVAAPGVRSAQLRPSLSVPPRYTGTSLNNLAALHKVQQRCIKARTT